MGTKEFGVYKGLIYMYRGEGKQRKGGRETRENDLEVEKMGERGLN